MQRRGSKCRIAPVLLVPQRAVQELQGKNFVWVVDDANKFPSALSR